MSKRRHSSRRDFLLGRAAIDRIGDIGAGEEGPQHESSSQESNRSPAESSIPTKAPSYIVQYGRQAMACEFEICFNAKQYPEAAQTAVEALDLVTDLENQLSIYREHTEISQINQNAASRPVAVEPGLFRLIRQALEIHAATGGAYDITASPLSRVWGFFERSGRYPTDQQLQEALAAVNANNVVLCDQDQTVRFRDERTSINLNSIGKGYALERCAALLEEHDIFDFFIHGGQSSLLARGESVDGPWTVGVRHPLFPEKRVAEIYLRDQSLGTSGSGKQFFYHEGKRYGHLLDPRTGRPAQGVYSVTVISRSAAEADALATAFYVMGREDALAYCEKNPHLAMLMICPGERSGSIEIETAGLDASGWRKLEA